MENKMKLEFLSKSSNESFARAVVAAFTAQLDPTLEELADIKTAVSEAVTNAIVHGYGHPAGIVTITAETNQEKNVVITISDNGKGIKDIEKAKQPLFSESNDAERAGMGFTVMETFMDTLSVTSAPNEGTTIVMTKKINTQKV